MAGQTKETLSEALLGAFMSGRTSLDFAADYGGGVHTERARDHGLSTTGGVALRTRPETFRERVRHRTSHLPLKSLDLTKVPLEDSVVLHDAPASRIGPRKGGVAGVH